MGECFITRRGGGNPLVITKAYEYVTSIVIPEIVGKKQFYFFATPDSYFETGSLVSVGVYTDTLKKAYCGQASGTTFKYILGDLVVDAGTGTISVANGAHFYGKYTVIAW